MSVQELKRAMSVTEGICAVALSSECQVEPEEDRDCSASALVTTMANTGSGQAASYHAHARSCAKARVSQGYLAQLFISNVRNYNNHRNMQSDSPMFKMSVRGSRSTGHRHRGI
jgi:hypothetical protein